MARNGHPLRVSVIGTGYLGLTHAVCMADLGHQVLAIDVDASKIAKAGLTFMAIDDDQNKAVKRVEDCFMRYYGMRFDVANTCLVGSPAAIIDQIAAFLSKGFDTLIIGVADPDPKQLDLFGEKVLPKLND